MGSCLRCKAPTKVGGLCERHVGELTTATDITAEQLQAKEVSAPLAWLIDQWGCTHGMPRLFTVGRGGDHHLAIYHHSVSSLHAEIAVREGGVMLRDRGSLNGTTVNGEPIRAGRIFDGDRLQFGDVSLYFVTGELPTIGAEGGTGRTVPTKQDELAYSARIQASGDEVELIEHEGGGIARYGGGEVAFGKLEFGLIKLVAMRREGTSEPARMYVPSAELAKALEFNSVAADGENVRELVRRVRRKLKGAGVADLIESRKGAGYRLAWPIKPSR